MTISEFSLNPAIWSRCAGSRFSRALVGGANGGRAFDDGSVQPQIRDHRGHLYTCARSVAAWKCRRRKRLKALEEGNGRLKKLLAESMMDESTLREIARFEEDDRELGH